MSDSASQLRAYARLAELRRDVPGRIAAERAIAELERKNYLAWPGFASEQDVKGLVPTVISVNECDPLRDEGIEYAQALSLAGTRTTHIGFERQIHGFILMGRVLDEANEAVAICAAQLRRALVA